MAQIYGFLTKAQFENTASDLANTLTGLVWFNTTDSAFRFYDSTAVRTVADLNSTQTIINKIITGNQMASFSPDGVETITAPVVSGNMLVDQHQLTYMDALHQATPAAPAVGGIRLYSKNDDKLYKQDSEGNEVEIGTGGAGLDVFHTEDFEVNNAADFLAGNNAAFLGGGVLAGTKTDVNTIAGSRNIRYTQAAGSLNDYIASPVFDIDPKQAGNEAGVNFYFTYNGNKNDLKAVVHDGTNVISSVLDLIQDASNPTRFSTSVFVPAGVTQLSWGIQVVVENIGAVLDIDDVQFSSDPFVYKNLIDNQDYTLEQLGSALTNVSAEVEFNLGTATITNTGTSLIVAEDDSANTRTKFIAQRDGVVVDINWSASISSAGQDLIVYKEGTARKLGNAAYGANTRAFVSESLTLNNGEFFSVGSNNTITGSTNVVYLSFTAKAETEHVITPAKSNLTDWNDYTPTFTGLGTVTSTSGKYRRVGKNMEIIVSATTGTVAASLASVSIPSGFNVDSNSLTINNTTANSGNALGVYSGGNATSGGTIVSAPSTSTSLLYFGGIFHAGIPNTPANGASIVGTGVPIVAKVSIPIAEWTSDVSFLAAVPVQRVAYLSEQQTSGTEGGTSLSGTTHTRTLNTVKGDSSIVSLSSNQFTLTNGIYDIEGYAPSLGNDNVKARLYDVTNAAYVIEGQSLYMDSSNLGAAVASVRGRLELSSSTTYELRHYILTGKATNGLGSASNQGTEVYSQVKITKIK